jgi:hypothetical protein
MKSLTALSTSIAVLGGLATFLALGVFSGVFLIWAVFVAWGAFFALGGTPEALKNTIVCGVFGVVMAVIAALLIINVPLAASLGLPLWAGIVVAATVLVLCLAANIPTLSAIPASVFGYAPTFAYLLQTPDMLSNEVMLSANLSNPLIVISISIAVGAGFGMLSGKLSALLTADPS